MTPETPKAAHHLVMLGYFGFGNAGDEAVLAAEVAALRQTLGPSTQFTVVSGGVEKQQSPRPGRLPVANHAAKRGRSRFFCAS